MDNKSGKRSADRPTRVTFRPVHPEDEGFLCQVYASTRAEEMASWDWNETEQESFLKMQFRAQHLSYLASYPDADFQIILLNERPIGRLYVERKEDQHLGVDITLLPEYRTAGIGGAIINDLLVEAAQAGKPFRIHVEKSNPAIRLYHRLGFSITRDSGVYFYMEWRPKEVPSVTFRSAGAADEAFLFSVYASTRAEEMALVPDQAQQQAFLKMQFTAQQQHYQSYFPDAEHQIILLSGLSIGRLYLDRGSNDIRILDITLLPEHRNAGIGTSILRDLQAEAAAAGKALQIFVESYNRSLRLFERLGFSNIEERGIHFLMEWSSRVAEPTKCAEEARSNKPSQRQDIG